MKICKPSLTPMLVGMKLICNMFSPSNIEVQDMDLIPYGNVVNSLIHATTCTWFDIAFVVNNTTQFMVNF
jgi:hypothetical protein